MCVYSQGSGFEVASPARAMLSVCVDRIGLGFEVLGCTACMCKLLVGVNSMGLRVGGLGLQRMYVQSCQREQFWCRL